MLTSPNLQQEDLAQVDFEPYILEKLNAGDFLSTPIPLGAFNYRNPRDYLPALMEEIRAQSSIGLKEAFVKTTFMLKVLGIKSDYYNTGFIKLKCKGSIPQYVSGYTYNLLQIEYIDLDQNIQRQFAFAFTEKNDPSNVTLSLYINGDQDKKTQFSLFIQMRPEPLILNVRYLCNLTNYYRMFIACQNLEDSTLESIILPTQEDQDRKISYSPDPLLNAAQQQAIDTYLKGNQGITMVQGPPGTGKTATIVAALSAIFTNTNKTCYVSAASNQAVLQLINGFLEKFPHAPVALISNNQDLPNSFKKIIPAAIGGNISYLLKTLMSNRSSDVIKIQKNLFQLQDAIHDIQEKYKIYSEDDYKEICCQFKTLKTILDQDSNIARQFEETISSLKYNLDVSEISQKIITSSRIFFSTLSSCGENLLLASELPPTEFIIIDEAVQASTPEIFIAFNLLQNQITKVGITPKVLLVGDPNQLSTIVFSENNKEILSKSLFEQLAEEGQLVSFLNIQYRMAAIISEFPSIMFYNNQLQNGKEEATSAAASPELPLNQLCFYSHKNIEYFDALSESYKNYGEAILIVKKILDLQKFSNKPQIGVIACYSAQKELIRDLLKQHKIDTSQIKISTVDGFQGSEADIILISFVRSKLHSSDSNYNHSIGFLNDARRLNVALTRAKNKVYLFGNMETLRIDPIFEKYENYLHEKGLLAQLDDIHTEPLRFSTTPKQQVCRFFKSSQACKYGTNCKFSHDVPSHDVQGNKNVQGKYTHRESVFGKA